MKKGCQCVDCEHRDYCNKRNKGGVVYCDCYAKGQPMTEQEFIQTCDTEQLAEWISSVVQKAISIKENNDIVMLESAIWWVEWLKQPHREE